MKRPDRIMQRTDRPAGEGRLGEQPSQTRMQEADPPASTPIFLDLGSPDHAPPETAILAVARLLKKADGDYGPPMGLQELRRLLAEQHTAHTGNQVDPGQIVVTAGASGAIAAILATLAQEGGESHAPALLALPDPGYPAYTQVARALGWQPCYYPCSAETNYLPRVEAIRALAELGVRVFLINSPSNPTGAIYPPALLAEIAGVVRKHDGWLLSDEVYADLTYDEPAVSLAAVAPERTKLFTIGSFSKTYSLAGWRVGFTVAPLALAQRIASSHWALTMGASTLAQHAAIGALKAGPAYVESVRETLRGKRDLVAALFHEAGIAFKLPASGFFAWIPLRPLQVSGATFVERCWRETQLAVQDGAAFGPGSSDHVCLSFAASEAATRSGCQRFITVWKRLAQSRQS